jgi:hypothetical protein
MAKGKVLLTRETLSKGWDSLVWDDIEVGTEDGWRRDARLVGLYSRKRPNP